ncbi:MAG: hypothetical protein K2X71_27990 [Methylobacterium sp.]|uniref:hypothetical protein n=1 Tax=Methylobacterium sp. TaxID=409 RepID=UPI00258DD8A4|nr:hypothetical protein [Methylobacterium sp.]MBY0299834.1 hypothetical protein [Methylobacterium sp.]
MCGGTLWHGLDKSVEDLRLYCRRDPEALRLLDAEVGAAPPHGGARERDDQADNVSLRHGNSPIYALRRLKRDRPDLADRVVKGELTPHAAAIEAGFRRRLVQVPVDDLDAAARVLRRHFGDRWADLVSRV